MAARAWGATRPLVDVDLYVPDDALPRIARATGDVLVRPPRRHRDEEWDVVFLRGEGRGVPVEVGGGDSARYRDRRTGEWMAADVRWDASVLREVAGVTIPVMPREELVRYKERLDRAVDRLDVAELRRPRP